MNLIEHFKDKPGWLYRPPRKGSWHVFAGKYEDTAEVHSFSADASLFMCSDGKYRLFSSKTCHEGEICETQEQVKAAVKYLKHAHKNNMKLCKC